MSNNYKIEADIKDNVVILDSLGDLKPSNNYPILVCGSHCGGNGDLAKHVHNCNVKAVFLNNAGIGKNQAGIRELINYNNENVLACAVDNHSAEIGNAYDTYENGIITHLNNLADLIGIQAGDTVKNAIYKINHQLLPINQNTQTNDNKNNFGKSNLKKQLQTEVDGITITVTDSITFLNENNVGDIVVCGSHGGVSAGKYAKKHRVKAVFFNDAGIGKNNAGIKSLEALNDGEITACTVDCMSAEIFNGLDTLENGIVTVCNKFAENKGISKNMSVKECIKLI